MEPENSVNASRGVARRTLLGAAWAAPVILLAVAAPMAAASGSGILIFNNSSLDIGGVRNRLTFNVGVSNPYLSGGATANATVTFFLNGVPRGSLPATMPNNASVALNFPVDGLTKDTIYKWFVSVTAPGFAAIYAPTGAPTTPGSLTTPSWWN